MACGATTRKQPIQHHQPQPSFNSAESYQFYTSSSSTLKRRVLIAGAAGMPFLEQPTSATAWLAVRVAEATTLPVTAL